MERPNYAKLFAPPANYKAPDENKLAHDTENPNYNSVQYRKKPINRTPKILNYFDCFDINKKGNLILGCNELTGRIWDGYVWGFDNVDEFGNENKASFKIHSNSNITNLIYYENNIFILSKANGAIEMWSTKSQSRDPSGGYCMFMIDNKTEHAGIILAMDILAGRNIAVTGCNQKKLKIWDVSKTDLFSIHTMHNAHNDSITSISANPTDRSIFVSCSRDRSALIWDYRKQRPATGLYENHDFDFTSVHWCTPEETNNELIYLGDESGAVYSVDPKMPKKILETIQVHNRPITKIKFLGNKMAVIGVTNVVKIYQQKNEAIPHNFACVYKDQSSENTVRDCLWNPFDCNELYTIGWDSKLSKHLVVSN